MESIAGSKAPDSRLPLTNVTHLLREPDAAANTARKTIVGTPAGQGGTP
jgi:hypothetical protein